MKLYELIEEMADKGNDYSFHQNKIYLGSNHRKSQIFQNAVVEEQCLVLTDNFRLKWRGFIVIVSAPTDKYKFLIGDKLSLKRS